MVTCLIPCYNTEKSCAPVVRDSLPYCDRLILINDGSTDNTKAVLEELFYQYPEKVEVISYEQNQGKGNALLMGMEKALEKPFDALVTIDADLQHLPQEIPNVIEPLKENCAMAIGQRDLKKMPFRSKFSNLFISRLLRVLYPNSPKDTQSGFRAHNYPFIKKIVASQMEGCFETELLILLYALHEKENIGTPKISTIYLDCQPTHFKKIQDSFKILKALFIHWKTQYQRPI